MEAIDTRQLRHAAEGTKLQKLSQEPYKGMLTNYEALNVELLLSGLSEPPDFEIAGIPVGLRKDYPDFHILNWKEIEQALNHRENPDNYAFVRTPHSLDPYIDDGSEIIKRLHKDPSPGYCQEEDGLQFIARLDPETKQCLWCLDIRPFHNIPETFENPVEEELQLPNFHLPLAADEVAISSGTDPSEVGHEHSLLPHSEDQHRQLKNDLIYSLLISEIIGNSHQQDFLQINEQSPNARFYVDIRQGYLDRKIEVFIRESEGKYVYAISRQDYEELVADLQLPESNSIKRYRNQPLPDRQTYKELFPLCHDSIIEDISWKISHYILLSPLASDLFSHIEDEIILDVPTDHWQLFYHSLQEAKADGFSRMEQHPDYPESVSFNFMVVRSEHARRMGEHGKSLYFQDKNDPSVILAFADDIPTLRKKLELLIAVPLNTYGNAKPSDPAFLSSESALEFSEIELKVESLKGLIWGYRELLELIRQTVKEEHGELDHINISAFELPLPDGQKVPFYIRSKQDGERILPAKVIKARDLQSIVDAYKINQFPDFSVTQHLDRNDFAAFSKISSSPSAAIKYLSNKVELPADENTISCLKGLALRIEHDGAFDSLPCHEESSDRRIISLTTDLSANGTPNGFTFRIRGTTANAQFVDIVCGNYRRCATVRAGHFDITLPSPERDTECLLVPVRWMGETGSSQILKVAGYNYSSSVEALQGLLETHCNLPEKSEIWTETGAQNEVEIIFLKHFSHDFEEGLKVVESCRENASSAVHDALDRLLDTFNKVKCLEISANLDFLQRYCTYKAFSAFKEGKKGYLLSACRENDKQKIVIGLAELIGRSAVVTADRNIYDWQAKLAENATGIVCIGSSTIRNKSGELNDFDLMVLEDCFEESSLTELIKQNKFILFTSESYLSLAGQSGKLLSLSGILPEELQNLDHHEVPPLVRFSEIARNNGLFLRPSDIYPVRTQNNFPESSIPNLINRTPYEFKLTEEQQGLLLELFYNTKQFLRKFGISGHSSDEDLKRRVYREIINGSDRFFYPEDTPKLDLCHSVIASRVAAGEQCVIYVAAEYSCQLLADYFKSKGFAVVHHYQGEQQFNIISDTKPLKPKKTFEQLSESLNRNKADIAIVVATEGSQGLESNTSCYRLLYDLPDNVHSYELFLRNAANPDSKVGNVYIDTLVPGIPTEADPELSEAFPALFKKHSYEMSLWRYYQNSLIKAELVIHGYFPPEYLEDHDVFVRDN